MDSVQLFASISSNRKSVRTIRYKEHLRDREEISIREIIHTCVQTYIHAYIACIHAYMYA
jgi:hypothetical protein